MVSMSASRRNVAELERMVDVGTSRNGRENICELVAKAEDAIMLRVNWSTNISVAGPISTTGVRTTSPAYLARRRRRGFARNFRTQERVGKSTHTAGEKSAIEIPGRPTMFNGIPYVKAEGRKPKNEV